MHEKNVHHRVLSLQLDKADQQDLQKNFNIIEICSFSCHASFYVKTMGFVISENHGYHVFGKITKIYGDISKKINLFD